MNTIIPTSLRRTFTHMAAVGACLVALSVHADDSFQVQIHPREVAGTWELIHGNYDRAVTLLEIAAAKSHRTSRDYGAILNNLCVAYLKQGSYGRAQSKCDQAVDFTYPPGVALNNRGVLQALQGRFVDASEDFEAAKTRRESVEAADFNLKQLGERVSEEMQAAPATASIDPLA